MTFIQYQWKNYKETPGGKAALKKYSKIDSTQIKNGFDAIELEIDSQPYKDSDFVYTIPDLTQFIADEIQTYETPNNQKEADEILLTMIEDGIEVREKGKGKLPDVVAHFGKSDEWYRFVQAFSIALHQAYPEFFFPYLDINRYYHFRKKCEFLGIPMPSSPKKADHEGRSHHYAEINEQIQKFRRAQGLKPEEMNALLYDYAKNCISAEVGIDDLPAPSKVWHLTGGAQSEWDFKFVDEAGEHSTSHWGGKPDIRRGDICLMYCASPRSYIHSIWRAITDGFFDPFFYFHGTIWIGKPIKVKPVHFKEMAADAVISQNKYMKANLQGPSGKAFSVEEYEALLKILEVKGQDISQLPRVEIKPAAIKIIAKDERDVEMSLIEPWLVRLGYSPAHWRRQVVVKMGRNEKVIPDYLIGINSSGDPDSARIIVEAKLSIASDGELEETFMQARSYALRVSAKVVVLAATEGVWIISAKGDRFDLGNAINKSWGDLNHPDHFHQIKLLIGKNEILN